MSDVSQFSNIVESLFSGMEAVASARTVVGDPIIAGDTTILPLTEISFGIGAGNGRAEKKNSGKGAIGGKITPVAVLVVKPDSVRLVSVRNQDMISQVLDMVPDVLEKLGKKKAGGEDDLTGQEALERAFPEGKKDIE